MVKISHESILIAGSGAMACLFAARLRASNVPVIMLGKWQESIRVLQQRGVTLVEKDGSEYTYAVTAITNPQECLGIHIGLVLVKSWQTERVARQLSACLSPEGVVLTLQNGLGNREILVKQLGEERVAIGATTVGAHLLAPGIVKCAGEGVISLGEHSRLAPIIELLQKAGFPVERIPNLESLLWGKLVINAAVNPLTALFEIPNGALIDNPYTERIIKEIIAEVVAVASAQNIQLPFSDASAAVAMVIRRTAENRSSMLQDIQRGAPTEIDAICGAIVEAGERAGVETPVNRLLWQLIRAKAEI